MTPDTTFTNGVIAVKEKALLGEKILRFPEMTAEEVLRALSESGFGGGASGREGVIEAEERALDEFIRAYAPTEADKAYFFAPRDFHNLKALSKAQILSVNAERMLAPEGLRTVAELKKAVENGEPPALVFEEGASGAEIGAAYDRAMYAYLRKVCKARGTLKKLLSVRADMTDLLTAMRADDREYAESLFIGGTLKKKVYDKIFSEDAEKREHALDKTPYEAFYKACLAAKSAGAPFTDAERIRDSVGEEYFFSKRFELSGKEPFLYYVFRRRAEIKNVRMILVCLGAGVPEKEIRKRLVGVR